MYKCNFHNTAQFDTENLIVETFCENSELHKQDLYTAVPRLSLRLGDHTPPL